MITLTATIEIKRSLPNPFKLGASRLGSSATFGTEVNNAQPIDLHNLLSLESELFDRSDLKMPSWGIISNKGKIGFNDPNKRFLGYANNGVLVEGAPVKIILSNTLVNGATEVVAERETDQWDYDNDNRTVSVTLKDDLEEWQEITIDGIDYDPRNPVARNLKYFYVYLWEMTQGNYNMLSFAQLDTETQSVLENTYVQYPLLESGTLWQSWDKLAQVAQAHIYKKKGVVIFRCNGGN